MNHTSNKTFSRRIGFSGRSQIRHFVEKRTGKDCNNFISYKIKLKMGCGKKLDFALSQCFQQCASQNEKSRTTIRQNTLFIFLVACTIIIIVTLDYVYGDDAVLNCAISRTSIFEKATGSGSSSRPAINTPPIHTTTEIIMWRSSSRPRKYSAWPTIIHQRTGNRSRSGGYVLPSRV